MKVLVSILFALSLATTAMAQTSMEQSILFQKDSVNVPSSQVARLELVVEYMKKHPAEVIIIGGFTSDKTPASKVQSLCDKRAEAVKQYLMEKYMIPEKRLIAIGAGVSTKYDSPAFNEVVEFFTQH